MAKEVYIVEDKQWDMYVDLGFNIKSQQQINVYVQKCKNGYMITGAKEEVIQAKQFYESNPINSKTVEFQKEICAELFVDVYRNPNSTVLTYLNTIIKAKHQSMYHISVETEPHLKEYHECSFPKVTVFARRNDTVDKIVRLVNQHIWLHTGIVDFRYMRQFIEKHSQKLKIVDSKEKNITTFVCTTDVFDEYMAIEITNKQIPVSSLIGDYLSSYGTELLSRLEKEFDVTFLYNQAEKCLDIRGDKSNIKRSNNELRASLVHKSLPTELNTEYLCSLKERFNSTAQENSCSFEMKFETQPDDRKLDNCRYIATWRHPRSRKTITLVGGHLTDIKTDSLILLMNDSLFSLHKDTKEWDGRISEMATDYFQKNHTKPTIGTTLIDKDGDKLQYNIVVAHTQPRQEMKPQKFDRLDESVLQIIAKLSYHKKKSLLVPICIRDGYISTKDIIRCIIEATQSAKEEHFASGLEIFICCSESVCDVSVITNTLDEFYKQLGPGYSRINHTGHEMVSKDGLSLKIKVDLGSLHEKKADVIVNTTSAALDLSIGTVSRVLLQYAGPTIQAECYKKYPNGITPSEIAVTTSGNLLELSNIKCVCHGVLKAYDGANDIKDVKNFVRGCLVEAELMRKKSIAFPALGTGTLKFPRRDVAKAMFDAVEDFEQESIVPVKHVKKVKFILFPSDKKTCDAFSDEENRRTQTFIAKHKLPKYDHPDNSSAIHGTLFYANKTVRLQVLVDNDSCHLPTSCVEVILTTKACKSGIKLSSKEPCTWLDQYTIYIQTDQKVEHVVKNAMEQCVQFCMEERVTGIVLKTNYWLNIPEHKQVEYMTNELHAALAAKKESCYLHTMYFIVPDRLDFDIVREKLLATSMAEKFSSYFRLKNISWKESDTTPKNEMSIELVGGTQASIDRVASKLGTILSTSQNEPRKTGIPSHQYEMLGARPKIPHKTNTQSSGIVASYDTDTNTDFDLDPHKIESKSDGSHCLSDIDDKDEPQQTYIEGSNSMFGVVSAEINQCVIEGIGQNLDKWISDKEHTFQVKIGNNNSDTVFVRGSLEQILRFETYLMDTISDDM